MPVQVQLDSLHKRYGDVHVVRGLSLNIAQGEVLCLLGPSGCGKTTTLRMVAGLEVPTDGKVSIGGEPVSGPGLFVPPERRRLGMVFQSYAVWPHRNVLDNVAYPLVIEGRRDALEKARAALEQVQLGGLEERYPHQLSGGQQQRVALARALVAEPQVLLLDEPLSNLDAKLREELRDEIRALVKRIGVTVIVVTHDQEEALSLSDRVAVMNAGVIAQCAAPQDLYHRPDSRFVAQFVGKLDALPAHALGGGRVRVGELELQAHACQGAPESGPCELGVRPESMSFASSGLPGVVQAASFLGSHVRYRVQGQDWQALVDAGSGYSIGEAVHLRPKAGIILGD
ncbi:MAG: iron(III) transport system ATP-binding protein [Cognaticolwellia sp.]|jgi:iron(III) transport system ATP-binding protein